MSCPASWFSRHVLYSHTLAERYIVRELSEKDRRETIAKFEAVGIATVQLAVDHPQSSPSIFGLAEKGLASRELAKEWLAEARPRERRRRRRHETLLWVGTISAAVAAIFSALAVFFYSRTP